MKNKGFTLVEIISVIVVLSIIMIIVVPNIGNVLFTSRSTISSLNRKNLEEAGKLLGQEVLMCSGDDPIVKLLDEKLEYHDITNCEKAKSLLESGFEVSIDFLKTNNYFTDSSNKCSGNLFIKMTDKSTQKITVDLKDAACTS